MFCFVFSWRYRVKGRGYITLGEFGNYEGMQNPNYDGELWEHKHYNKGKFIFPLLLHGIYYNRQDPD